MSHQFQSVFCEFEGIRFVLSWKSLKFFLFYFHESFADSKLQCSMEIRRLGLLKPWRKCWHSSLHQIVLWWARQVGIILLRIMKACILEQWSFTFWHVYQERGVLLASVDLHPLVSWCSRSGWGLRTHIFNKHLSWLMQLVHPPFEQYYSWANQKQTGTPLSVSLVRSLYSEEVK